MIKINLCPVDEIESPHWWIVDASVLALIVVGAIFGVKFYLAQTQSEVESIRAKIEDIKASEQTLAADLQRYRNMEKDEVSLQSKLKSLQKITVSKISKFRTLVVLEHLANLRPEGVWYQSIKIYDDTSSKFELRGQAFDNLLVAELIMALKSTITQEYEDGNVRTNVYFDKVKLEQSAQLQQAPRGFPELIGFPEFTIHGEFFDRTENQKNADQNIASPPLSVTEDDFLDRKI